MARILHAVERRGFFSAPSEVGSAKAVGLAASADSTEGVPLSLVNGSLLPVPEIIPLPEPFSPPVAINQTRLKVQQLTNYQYVTPARRIVTYLRLMPVKQRGWQTRLRHQLQTAPLAYTTLYLTDSHQNELIEVRHERVETHLTFAVEMEVQTHCAFTEKGFPLPTPISALPGENRMTYQEITRRTTPNEALRTFAAELQTDRTARTGGLTFFQRIGESIHEAMQFDSEATGIGTTAAEAWANRRGVCQDYTHIMLTVCRLCGIPARYVSGFVPGEGVMHAWVEGWLPVPGKRASVNTGESRKNSPCEPNPLRSYWFAYDPTYNKWVDDRYVTVATGREFGDITPTSGTYYGGASTIQYRNFVTILDKKIHLV